MLNVGLLNARSVCNKADSINDYIVSKDFDIFFITETWLTCENEPALAQLVPEGYDYFLHIREEGRGGGIAVIHKQTLKVE